MSTLPSALVGHTGFVGSNLLRQRPFDHLYNSANIEEIAGRSFGLIVCSGAPAEKWKANRDPEGDLANLARLRDALCAARAERVVLISTVDVFAAPVGVDEDSAVDKDGLHAYGLHRRMLEEAVSAAFPTLVVRLPGLYGRGLKKNAIFDLLHDNDVHKIDSRGRFQFYGLDRLWSDVEAASAAGLDLVHLATEPVTVGEIAREAFGLRFENHVVDSPATYDLRTRHAEHFGGSGGYIESRSQVLGRIAEFVARERVQ